MRSALGCCLLAVALACGGGGGGGNAAPQPHVPEAAPKLAYLSPLTVIAGGPAFSLEVHGTGFYPDTAVWVNGNARPTTYVSGTLLRIAIPAPDIAAPGQVKVRAGDRYSEGGGDTALNLTISSVETSVIGGASNDLLWDPVHQVLYASMAASASTGNAIAVIDPAAWTVTATVPVPCEPKRLALSDDGQFLYAGLDEKGTIQRFTLPGLVPDLLISLGMEPFFQIPYMAKDIQVQPGAPRTLAVSLGCWNTDWQGLAAIFDDGKPRDLRTSRAYSVDWLQWGRDAGTLYGAESMAIRDGSFLVLSVAKEGVTVTKEVFDACLGSRDGISLDAGAWRIYSGSGIVVDPGTGARLGSFPAYGAMARDSQRNLAFIVSEDLNTYAGVFAHLQSFDLTRFTPIASVAVNLPFLRTPTRLVRCGDAGLALGGIGTPVYRIKGPLVLGR